MMIDVDPAGASTPPTPAGPSGRSAPARGTSSPAASGTCRSTNCITGSGSFGWTSGSGRRMPFGLPSCPTSRASPPRAARRRSARRGTRRWRRRRGGTGRLRCGVDAQERLHLRRHRGGGHRDVELRRRRDEQPGVAVLEDVGDLLGGQVRVDARVVEPGALGGGHRLEVPEVVLHEERDVVAAAQPGVAVQVGEPVGVRLELGERQRLARSRP